MRQTESTENVIHRLASSTFRYISPNKEEKNRRALAKQNQNIQASLCRITDSIYSADSVGNFLYLNENIRFSHHHNGAIEGLSINGIDDSQVEVLVDYHANYDAKTVGKVNSSVFLRGACAREVVPGLLSPYVQEVSVSAMSSGLVLRSFGLNPFLQATLTMRGQNEEEDKVLGPQGGISFIRLDMFDDKEHMLDPNGENQSTFLHGFDRRAAVTHRTESGVYLAARTVFDKRNNVLKITNHASVANDCADYDAFSGYSLLPNDTMAYSAEGLDVSRELIMPHSPLDCAKVITKAREMLAPILSLNTGWRK